MRLILALSVTCVLLLGLVACYRPFDVPSTNSLHAELLAFMKERERSWHSRDDGLDMEDWQDSSSEVCPLVSESDLLHLDHDWIVGSAVHYYYQDQKGAVRRTGDQTWTIIRQGVNGISSQ